MILSIDIGSTGVRALLVNHEGGIVSSVYQRVAQFFPRLGWLEHDLEDIWTQCLAVCRGVLASAGVDAYSIKGIGITTQRNTLAIWDRSSGRPLFPAISWADNRTQDLCRTLSGRDDSDYFLKRSGRALVPSNLGLRLRWVMETDEVLKTKLLSGTALWGMLDTWLVWKLTSGAIWGTDYSNAACSGIFDLLEEDWSKELLEFLELPDMGTPELRPTVGDWGETTSELTGHPLPISCVSGDQYASLFGQGCLHPGMAKCTLGTGGFFVVNVGERPARNIKEIITRICWNLGDGSVYGLEGAIFHVGTLIEWLSAKLGFAEHVEQTAALAANAESRGLYIVPAFSGLGCPFWDAGAKALVVGASLDTGPGEFIRAGLEAVAFRIKDMVEAMRKSVSVEGLRVRFDGNVSMNDTLMQIVADQLQSEVERSSSSGNRSALGAAFMAGLHCGVWNEFEEVGALWSPDRVFYPEKPAGETELLYQGWKDAVRRSRGLCVN